MSGCLQSFRTHTADKVYDAPPEGGYGWWIVGGHFINIGIGYGFTKSIGIFFPYIREEFNVNSTVTSLIFSIMMFTQYSGSLIGNVIYRKFGPRWTLWLGGLLCGSGLMLVGVMQTLWSMYMGVGVMVGVGFSFVILVGTTTISRYFKKKRPQGIAFAMTGVPIFSFMFPILYEFLYNNFSMFGAMLVMGALQLNVCVGASVFRPITLASDSKAPEFEANPFKRLIQPFKRLLKNANFLFYSTAIALVISGKFMVNPFIKDYAVYNIGLEKYQPAQILSICSGIDIISRPLGGKLCSTKFIREKVGTFETFAVAVLGLASCNMFAPFWVTSYATFAVYGVIFGIFFGLTIGVEWSNVAELVETDIYSDAITFIQLETSIGVLLAPMLGGYLSDKTGDFSYVFYIAGFLLYGGAACAIIVAARRRCSLKEIEMEKAEDEEELKEDIVKDGFNPDGTNPNLLGATGGSQTVASKSLLGVNVAVNPTARFRQKSSSEKEKVKANSRSSSSRSSSAESLKIALITDSAASLHA